MSTSRVGGPVVLLAAMMVLQPAVGAIGPTLSVDEGAPGVDPDQDDLSAQGESAGRAVHGDGDSPLFPWSSPLGGDRGLDASPGTVETVETDSLGEAVDVLEARASLELDPDDRSAIDDLGSHDARIGQALSSLVDAFSALHTASRDVPADPAPATDAPGTGDAGPSLPITDELGAAGALGSGERSDVPTPGLRAAEGTPPRLPATLPAGDGDEVHAAQRQLLDAVRDLREALDRTPGAGQGSSADGHVDLCPVAAFDLVGRDSTYQRNCMLILDVGGDDRYHNNAGGNGVGAICSSLPDAGPTALMQAAALVDLGRGNDEYGDPDDPRSCGANGGGRFGSGFLYDGGGTDTYVAGEGLGGGVNGGSSFGVGFLLDRGGDDTYVAATQGANGGASGGSGFLLDADGDDRYQSDQIGSNGGGVAGTGTLVDRAGDDEYLASGGGSNGGGQLGGRGLLFDRAGDDRYVATATSHANGAGGKGIDESPGLGTLVDAGGSDLYADPLVPGGSCGDCTRPSKGNVGLQFDSDQLPADRAREACRDRDPHPPIRVTGDRGPEGFAVGLTPAGEPIRRPGSGIVAGSGTAGNPYVIRGWCIQAAPEVPAIHVADTDAHLRIEDVAITGTRGIGEVGVQLEGASNVTVTDNNLSVTELGLFVDGGEDVTVSQNRVTSVLLDAITVVDSRGTAVTGNVLANPLRTGVALVDAPGSVIRGNEVRESLDGYGVVDSEGVQMTANVADVADRGLAAFGTDAIDLRGNDLAGGQLGTVLVDAEGARATGNQLAGERVGLWILDSVGGHLEDNRLDGTAGLELETSENIEVRENDLGRGLRVVSSGPQHTDHVVENNTVLGEPLRYVHQASNATVPTPAGQVIVANATDVTLQAETFRGATDAVQIYDSSGTTVQNVTVEDSGGLGLEVRRSSDTTIQDTSVRRSSTFGVLAAEGDGTLLGNVTATGNGLDGVRLFDVSQPRVVGGRATGNGGNGLSPLLATDAVIENVTARGNGGDGVFAVLVDGWTVAESRLDDNARRGIVASATAQGQLSNTTARGNDGIGAWIEDTDGLTVRDNRIEHNDRGLVVEDVTEPSIRHNSLEANRIGLDLQEVTGARAEANQVVENSVGVTVTGDVSDVILRSNNVRESSSGVGLNASGATETVDARDNWWGCPEGPGEEGCDEVAGDVLFSPWLSEPSDDAGPR